MIGAADLAAVRKGHHQATGADIIMGQKCVSQKQPGALDGGI